MTKKKQIIDKEYCTKQIEACADKIGFYLYRSKVFNASDKIKIAIDIVQRINSYK